MAEIQDISTAQQKRRASLLKRANVIGLGIGYKETAGKSTDELSLMVLVREKEELKALSKKDIVPGTIDGVQTDVLKVGKVVAYHSTRERHRPAFPGVSIGHFAAYAGTFGMVVRDAVTKERLILSNNHILANCNNAQAGDLILQPAPADGGKPGFDDFARLVRFIKLKYDGAEPDKESEKKCLISEILSALLNIVPALFGSGTRFVAVKKQPMNDLDAALGRPLNENDISEDIMDIGSVTGITEASAGMQVKKSGRTTGLTSGTVKVINGEMPIDYAGDRKAYFQHQILTGDMTEPGDSGSILLDQHNRAVGLLCGGSQYVSVFNPITVVKQYLNFEI
ncbi:hypothetical protein JXQ31_11385 [candidate division KSB1 bacterium]|nr:hypothetical protein [candidate division KSB1 bacterium]